MKRGELRTQREKLKLTQKELAEKLDISEVYVRKLEAGDVNPGREMMIKFEEFYLIDFKKLFPDLFLRKNDKEFIKKSKSSA